MSKKIYMIRHGESMGNAWEYAYNHEEMNFLTNLGQQQARAAGKTLLKNKVQIDEWHCSKMVRARHTLSLISSEIGCWKTEFPQTRYNLHMDLNENHTWASPSDHANAVGQFVSRVVNPFLNSHSEAQTLGIVSHYYDGFTVHSAIEEIRIHPIPHRWVSGLHSKRSCVLLGHELSQRNSRPRRNT